MDRSLSFSTTIKYFGFFSNIFSVKFPVPGPISKTISDPDISPQSIFDKYFYLLKILTKLFFGI